MYDCVFLHKWGKLSERVTSYQRKQDTWPPGRFAKFASVAPTYHNQNKTKNDDNHSKNDLENEKRF